jgi:membrane protease YdiL (CAAX protease family)
MILGVLFGYLLVWSGSIWLPVIAHFVNNAVAVMAIFFIDKNLIDPKVENIGSTPDSYYSALISIVMVCALLLVLKQSNRDNIIPIKAA